jgi:hypothetical protein
MEEMPDGSISDCYPARVSFRGFPEETEDEGFRGLTNYIYNNVSNLVEDQVCLDAKSSVQYYKKSIVEAVQWAGDNWGEMRDHVKLGVYARCSGQIGFLYSLDTSEGELTARPGDWVVKDEDGKYSICSRKEFALKYEKADGV